MTSVWVLLLTFSVISTEISWDQYKQKHELNFDDAEEDLRRKIFEGNVQYIEAENAKGHSYKLGINHFFHWTQKELDSMFMTPKHINVSEEQDNVLENDFADDDVNEDFDVDWRRNKYVTSIKDQKNCGACYAFAAVANLESARAMKSKVLQDLSAQQVIDCGINSGCQGGSHIISYMYLIQYGSMTWASYPYRGYKSCCDARRSKIVTKPKTHVRIKGAKDHLLFKSVIVRPTTVSMHSNIKSFLFYSSGIYSDPACTADKIDHAAVIIGVLQDSKNNYYILKNSWGTSWGIKGYMHLSRNPKNLCSVATYPSYLVMP